MFSNPMYSFSSISLIMSAIPTPPVWKEIEGQKKKKKQISLVHVMTSKTVF